MNMNIATMGLGVIDAISMMCVLAKTTESDLISFTVVGTDLEVRCEKGNSIYHITFDIHALNAVNIIDVLANVATLAKLEHKSKVYQIDYSIKH
ncbi:hypothetical protein VPHD220_0158 [Vibrio phage D220]